VVEINLVARVETQADRADVAFRTATWIQGTHHILIAEILHAADEGAEIGGCGIEPRIQETALDCNEGVKIGMTDQTARATAGYSSDLR
jgi:hypothetical protein